MPETNQLSVADKRASRLALFIGCVAFVLPVLAFIPWAWLPFMREITLVLYIASPLMLPILAITQLRRVSKVGAGLLLISVLMLMLFVGASWLLIADNLIRVELAEGVAVEMIGSVFTAISIVVISETVDRFKE